MILSLGLTLVYLLSWVFYQKNQFLERDNSIVYHNKKLSKRWHQWKFVQQVCFFFIIYLHFGLEITLVNIGFYWILFDAFLNKFVLNREFFYIGKTSVIDSKVRWIASKIKIDPYKLSAILKISLILLSILYIYIK